MPYKVGRPERYGGRGPTFDTPAWLHEVPAEEVHKLDLDLILLQAPQNYLVDQYELLSSAQLRLPKVYLEHNAPRPHPTDSKHIVDDPHMLLVHVTHYNHLMWDSGCTPTRVIEHSVVIDPPVAYQGTREKGITVVNGMPQRGRLVGHDLFLALRKRVPLDLAGMLNEGMADCLGDIPYRHLHSTLAQYRFLFSPIRYTSLPLAVIEGLTIGMPIVALATTELPGVIEQGKQGFLSCDVDELSEQMQFLLTHPQEAKRMGEQARKLAHERFSMERFIRDWNAAFALVTGITAVSQVS